METIEKRIGYDWYVIFINLKDKATTACIVHKQPTILQAASRAFLDYNFDEIEFEILSITRI